VGDNNSEENNFFIGRISVQFSGLMGKLRYIHTYVIMKQVEIVRMAAGQGNEVLGCLSIGENTEVQNV
jgi:hypothetical protein